MVISFLQRHEPAIWASTSCFTSKSSISDLNHIFHQTFHFFKFSFSESHFFYFPGDKNVERVLAWKFGTLDENGDGFLDTEEYKELRRLAKRAVRPKKCARTFTRTCDLNRDSKLSRQEWAACLSNDFTREFEMIDKFAFFYLVCFLLFRSSCLKRLFVEDENWSLSQSLVRG